MSELEQLIENSKANEAIARKLFEIETEILTCHTSEQLLSLLFQSIKSKFDISNIALLMAEPAPVDYLLNACKQSTWYSDNSHAISQQKLAYLFPQNKPLLTNHLANLQQVLPQQLLNNTASLALLPLTIEGEVFAALLFTDDHKERFTQAHGTFHLEQLAVKISLSLTNVMIREQLEYMANYDRLTGVANRRLMEQTLNEELIRQQRYQVPFSILFVDCDKFKTINDTYGHACGDKVLIYVAKQLTSLIRENDRCFRFAGDEFVILLASQSYKEAVLAGQRLTTYFCNNPMHYEDLLLPITISCGAAASDGVQTMEELLKKADQQLYLDKQITSPSSSHEH